MIAVLIGNRRAELGQVLQHRQQNGSQVGPLLPAAVEPVAIYETGDPIHGAPAGLSKLIWQRPGDGTIPVSSAVNTGAPLNAQTTFRALPSLDVGRPSHRCKIDINRLYESAVNGRGALERAPRRVDGTVPAI
jgi:hypothetical protein